MSKFEDRLFDTLMREHGHALVVAERPTASHRRPVRAAAGAGGAKNGHWGRWVAAVGTVAAVVAGVLVVQTVQFGDQPAASSAVAEVLTRAADKIGASDPVVKPGQYLYIESHQWQMANTSAGGKQLAYLQESVTQTWVPYDRTQEWVQRSHNTGQRKWVHGSDADLVALGVVPNQDVEEVRGKCGDFYPEGGMRPCQRKGGWQEPTAEFVATLPSDPQQLYDRIRAAMADEPSGPDWATLGFVKEAIQRGLMPAELRANLYRALALLPSLEVTDRNANLDGRLGIGLGADRGDQRVELIIDPATGQFIGERLTATRSRGVTPAGTVVSYTSLSTGVVDKVGDEPKR